MTATNTNTNKKVLLITYIAIFASLTAICAWISIPLPMVEFTMQTFAVFLTMYLLGGKNSTMAVIVYLLLGAIGVPVFAHFTGGIGALLGTTGGYLIGFLAQTLIYWLATKFLGDKMLVRIVAMVVGLFVCYAAGTAWFVVVYTQSTAAVSIGTALLWCVTPFIIPDLAKLALAVLIGERLKRHVKI